ncbi:MAG: fused MFS/spermidine synthase [Fimbriimonadaceae bacterium]
MIVALYTFAIFVSASLLFLIQPMFTRLVLPVLGGSPSVWNTALVFYQAVLLAGYAYAHYSIRKLGAVRQTKWHLGIMLLPLVVMPISVRQLSSPPTDSSPVVWLLLTMVLSVGLPFFVVSAGSPLLQRWFSRLDHPNASDPYFLYAASNVGSMAALLAYPLGLEPNLTLRQQTWLWTGGYVLMIGLFALAATAVWRAKNAGAGADEAESASPAPTRRRKARWVLLAFVPVSFMMGVTTYLSTDVASIPLLWAIPLALYLLTFILAFARRRLVPQGLLAWVVPPVVLATIVAMMAPIMQPQWLLLVLGLSSFFLGSLACHQELADDRPAPEHLTEYFLLISLGGVLGGLFCGILAPILFNQVLEYAIAMVLCLALMPGVLKRTGDGPVTRRTRWMDLAFGLAVLAAALGLYRLQYVELDWRTAYSAWFPLAVPGALCLIFLRRPLRMAYGGAALVLAALFAGSLVQNAVYFNRDFFGSVRVVDWESKKERHFIHGTTIHGMQSLDPALRTTAFAYYHPDGPIGDLFRSREFPPGSRVGVVGLGAGSVAAYAKPGQHWTFYEIDPAVRRIAENPKLFTYLHDMKAPHQIVLGDARFSLQNTDRTYDLLVLAAYSSATVPVHLLTREAFAVYLSRLRPGGIMVMHIGNRFLDLEPVVGGLARDAGLAARIRTDFGSPIIPGRTMSQWVALARTEADLGPLATMENWLRLRVRDDLRVWTDDYSSVVAVLRVLNPPKGRIPDEPASGPPSTARENRSERAAGPS